LPWHAPTNDYRKTKFPRRKTRIAGISQSKFVLTVANDLRRKMRGWMSHQSEKVGDYSLWSRVGFVDSDSKTIAWGGSNYYDHGNPPAIALNNNNIAVEVHQSQKSGDYSLWSRVGFVDPDHKNIFWGDSNYYDHGNPPAVAIDGDNLVIEVHQSQKTNDYSLWYRTGTVDQDHRTIAWGDSNYYDHGTPPSVAVNNTGTGVVEIHQTEQYLNSTLWYHLGYVDYTGKAITWGDSNSCGLGIDSPSIALNNYRLTPVGSCS
jgi:hypothetical protein